MGHVRRIVWCPASASEPDNLWPTALPERYAAVPDSKITSKDLIGTWEHINLVYDYAHQNLSQDIVLKADGTVTGAITGKWSYDETTKRLTLGDVVVCVERELDWEANPRRQTIVYAGVDKKNLVTYWGKKK
jgi:arabinan endo-1,5-alpha-L-arabinosidase